MKPAVIGTLLLVSIAAAGWLLIEQPSSPTPPGIENSAGDSGTKREPGAVASGPGNDAAAVAKLGAHVEQLRDALQAVVVERKSAEAQLQQAERDVTALEQFIEEIKARGEDPADYAEEGLALFQPAFSAYQDAFSKLERAEAMEQSATQELATAEKALASAHLRADNGQ